jgi:3-hydroxybutyryl-CoA dehydrogenase
MASLKTVGVIGTGTMGSGIAQVAGLPVAMIDVDGAAIPRRRNAISANLDRLVKKEKLSASDKDAALGYLIGLDVVLAVMDVFYRDFNDPKYRPAPMLKEMVGAGHLGRKSGRGFYTYEAR